MKEERKAIDLLHEQWLEYFHKGDSEGISSLYTENIITLAPGSKLIKGRAGIAAIFTKMFESAGGKGLSTDYSIDTFQLAGDYVYITGEYKLFTKGEKTLLDYAKHVVIFKKVNGKWYFHRDLWNDNGPITSEELEQKK